MIEPRGEKYKFGYRTIQQLEKKKTGTPTERVTAALVEAKCLTLPGLLTMTALEENVIMAELSKDEFISINKTEYTLRSLIETLQEEFADRVSLYHEQNPMKLGMNKAELFQHLEKDYPKSLLEFVLHHTIEVEQLKRKGQFIAIPAFIPHVPENWQKKTENMLAKLQKDGYDVRHLADYFKADGIPDHLSNEMKTLPRRTGTNCFFR